MGAIPADYFKYYYFRDEVLAELQAEADAPGPRTSSRAVPDYWAHYREQADARRPDARPGALARRHPRARAGDRRDGRRLQRHATRCSPSTCPNGGGALARLRGDAGGRGAGALSTATGSSRCRSGRCRARCAGWSRCWPSTSALAAEAAWRGTRRDGVRALAANPLVRSLDMAEAIYDELAARPSRASCPSGLLA